MSAFICKINNAFYDIQEILRRITPIEYCETCIPDDGNNCHSLNGTLIIDSNAFIYGQLSFPKCDGSAVGTTINGDGIKTGYIDANTGNIQDMTVENLIVTGGFTGAGMDSVIVLQEYLPGFTLWPTTDVQTTIIEIDIPKKGVWQAIGKLSLTNDGQFIDLYSVAYGINTSFLLTNYYTPMAKFQDLPFEFVQVFEVTSLPFTISFNIVLTYANDPLNSGFIDENFTSLTAVRLGNTV